MTALREALRLQAGLVDFLEVRVDHFVADLEPLRRALPKLRAPLIITVRHPLEGGAGDLPLARRRALYMEFLPFGAFIDLELRSLRQLQSVRDSAGARGVRLIVSHHRFDITPPLEKLHAACRAAREARPEVFKVATLTRTAGDVATLLSFLATAKTPPALSAMGMGDFGKASRLMLARAGSVLNYGFLGEAQLPGQWPARLLRQRLSEIL